MTVTLNIRNEKAVRLLQNLAELNLIEFLPPMSSLAKPKLSSFIGQLKMGKTIEQLDEELNHLRNGWDRAN